MAKRAYAKPEVVSSRPIVFETTISGGNNFPGLGNGVGGNPSKDQGLFPGNGGVFPGGPGNGNNGNGNGNGGGNGRGNGRK
ncbi:hypothetical protein [Paenibacillus soyae]|uniref:Uncharacterized protein n=1 Tax=Paenibacillus soyae TaxID=2969249 RepID=A0A9X2MV32_9BACL|nr:hypothetical protein [Paenibacillus soyae]MCR2807414.1 hypothetical protein [Paenibacillus soyae]